MTALKTWLLLFANFIFLITISRAQERSPHGLAYESPIAFSPEAYDFFHPNIQSGGSGKGASCISSECSTLPVAAAATVQSTPGHESTSGEGRKRLGAGAIASIPIGFLFALLVGLGVYFVVIARRSNAARAKTAQLQSDV